MTKEEYRTNVFQRAASIMIGALLQDTAASIDCIITTPNISKEVFPHCMDLCRALYDVAEIIQDRVSDTDDISRALDFLDKIGEKVLNKREDLK